jgi:cation diffusion facilitator CzcD-associated flavoprotein CzcO
MADSQDFDVVVIGAGFAGLYALHKFRDDLGLDVRVLEAGDGIGGTWYWNRYPGARCDTESYYYCYSFSRELAQEWEWSSRYAEQPEVERYLNHVADRFDLRRDIRLSTKVTAARFVASSDRWEICTDDDDVVTARFLVTAVGCLSVPNVPAVPGLDQFEGDVYVTATWPRDGVDFSGMRVALIGTGSTGIQIAPYLAKQAEQLTVFQRTPNFSVPARQRPFAKDEQQRIKSNYDAIFELTRQTWAGYPIVPLDRATMDASDEERIIVLEEGWAEGGFQFFLGGFKDLLADPDANELASEFIRNKIRETVHDPATAEMLCPQGYPYGAKRPPIDTEYFETFNRDNVTLVDIGTYPIEEVTALGLRTTATSYEFDAIVFATGFDALTGALLNIDFQGANGVHLVDEWADGPRTMLGLQVAGFPNLFTVTGPGSPSIAMNAPVAIEHHVDWIADCLEYMDAHGYTSVEPTREAQDAWVQHVAEVGAQSLLLQANSYQTGANIPGKPRVVLPYTGGQPRYRAHCSEVVEAGYAGFKFTERRASDAVD